MSVLGHKVFVPLTQKTEIAETSAEPQEEQELFLSRKLKKLNLTVEAHAKQTSEGFVVLKGSMISPEESNISSGNSKKRRECNIDENHILQEDVLFSSPSSAAEFVTGKSSNGWVMWKNKEGKTLHDLENKA